MEKGSWSGDSSFDCGSQRASVKLGCLHQSLVTDVNCIHSCSSSWATLNVAFQHSWSRSPALLWLSPIHPFSATGGAELCIVCNQTGIEAAVQTSIPVLLDTWIIRFFLVQLERGTSIILSDWFCNWLKQMWDLISNVKTSHSSSSVCCQPDFRGRLPPLSFD